MSVSLSNVTRKQTQHYAVSENGLIYRQDGDTEQNSHFI